MAKRKIGPKQPFCAILHRERPDGQFYVSHIRCGLSKSTALKLARAARKNGERAKVVKEFGRS